MPVTLYRKQRQILEYIRTYIETHGHSPTLQEIADAQGLSSLATVHEHLQALNKKGVIKRSNGLARGIEVVPMEFSHSEAVDLPLMGFIAAGQPIEPFTDQNATVSVTPFLLSSGKRRSYVLKVKGESMIEDGILDGDYVVVEEIDNTQVRNGDIVVALLENNFATLKRFFKEPNRVRLEPANATMKPIYATDVKVQGRVSGVLRKYNRV